MKATRAFAKWLVAGSLAYSGFGFAAAESDSVYLSKDASPGEELYVERGCYQCHGLEGQGSNISGPSLNPLRLSGEAFAQYVRNPTRAMPPYTRVSLSDSELAAIETYVRDLPAPKLPREIPLLALSGASAVLEADASTTNVGVASTERHQGKALERGRLVYAAHCAACHGSERAGGIGAPLREESRKRDRAATEALIRNPPPQMPRLFPTPLSQEDVEDVAAFIRAS